MVVQMLFCHVSVLEWIESMGAEPVETGTTMHSVFPFV